MDIDTARERPAAAAAKDAAGALAHPHNGKAPVAKMPMASDHIAVATSTVEVVRVVQDRSNGNVDAREKTPLPADAGDQLLAEDSDADASDVDPDATLREIYALKQFMLDISSDFDGAEPSSFTAIDAVKEAITRTDRIHKDVVNLKAREQEVAKLEAALKIERDTLEAEKSTSGYVALRNEVDDIRAQNIEIISLLNTYFGLHGTKRDASDAFGDSFEPAFKKSKNLQTPAKGTSGLALAIGRR